MATAAERFWAKVSKSDGCWLWTAATGSNGYGRFLVNGALVLPHRWSYEQVNGPLTRALVVDHLCRNVSCVNPQHLDAVSQQDNIRRGLRSTPGIFRKPLCRKGHALTPENTETRRGGGRRCVVCRRARENAYKARRRAEARVA